MGAQNIKETNRIKKLETKIDSVTTFIPNLNKTVNFNVSNIQLPSFIRAVGNETKVNISVSPELKNIVLSHNFSNASVRDIIIYLCKEHQLTYTLTGNIISLNKIIVKQAKIAYVPRKIDVAYDKNSDLFSIELKNDSIALAFKTITNKTGKNLVFSPDLGNKKVSIYIKDKPFDSAMEKLAFANELELTKTKDGYYLFQSLFQEASNVSSNSRGKNRKQTSRKKPARRYQNKNFYFKVKDSIKQILEVEFENVAIGDIIRDIGLELNVNMFTNAPLSNIGKASVKAEKITYEDLLTEILLDTKFTYRKNNDIYFFGTNEQASLRITEIVPLMHRSIEVMNTPTQSNRGSFNAAGASFGGTNNSSFNTGGNLNNTGFNSNNQQGRNIGNQQSFNTSRSNSSFSNYSSKSEAILSFLPKDIVKDLAITTDKELNSFIVSGDAQKIKKFKSFIKKIDKPVPVILIEVMILEVRKSATIDTGVEFGLGSEPVNDSGVLFPSGNVTLGATSINKIIGGFNGFGSLNVGKVVPNFYARIQAMETNGNIKIRSTPKLTTLNGHQATLSNGQRMYYAVTRRDIIGSQNPQTSEIKNYYPIDADLSINIKPMMAGDGQITMSINVAQSSFDGERIDPEAPPGMSSREFNSTIRVKDQDVIILGGLEENVKNDSSQGVPFLARIPIIKWFFSKRTKVKSKAKLSVLIKPTIIR